MKKRGCCSTLVLLFASMLTGSRGVCAPPQAEEDPSKFVFRPEQPKTKDAKPPEDPEEDPREKEPPAPLREVEGDFTECTAARMMQKELARRVSDMDPSRAGGKTWTEYSNSQALSGRWGEHIARDEDCGRDADPGLAERILKLYRTVVDYPDMRRLARIRAPLTLSTAAEAGRLLDRVKGILDSRQLQPILKPAKADSPSAGQASRGRDDPERELEAEFGRRAHLLAEALEHLTKEEGNAVAAPPGAR